MTVSVVVPCYNHARWVPHCLGAIDAQDHDDVEVIVVDDGSTDGSWEAIASQRWSASRRVRNVRAPHLGAHAALNRGLALATGDWVTICNDDDRFAPRRLSSILEGLRATRARFAFTGVRFVDDRDVDVTDTLPFAAELHRRQERIATHPSVGFAILASNVAISTGNFFFERALLDEVGYFRPYRYVHDWDFLLRVVLVTEPVWIAEPLYFYRFHEDNTFRSLGRLDEIECPEVLHRYLGAAIRARPANRLAPSPWNWPVYFETFVEEHGWLRAYLPRPDDAAEELAYRP